MARMTEAVLLGSGGIPIRVRDETSQSPSGPVVVDAVKVVFAISWWAQVACGGESVMLESGTILTILPGTECFGIPLGHSRTVTLYLHSDFIAGELRWLSRKHPIVHMLERFMQGRVRLALLQLPPSALHDIVPRLVRMADLDAEDGAEFMLLSIASEIAVLVGRFSGATMSSQSGLQLGRVMPRQEVAAAVAPLRQHPDHAWSMAELAHRVSLSISQLSRLLRNQIGLSLAAYLTQVRTDRMAELLATRHISIADAARAVGWGSTVVASKAFKRRFGVSARAFAVTSRGVV